MEIYKKKTNSVKATFYYLQVSLVPRPPPFFVLWLHSDNTWKHKSGGPGNEAKPRIKQCLLADKF